MKERENFIKILEKKEDLKVKSFEFLELVKKLRKASGKCEARICVGDIKEKMDEGFSIVGDMLSILNEVKKDGPIKKV